MVVERHRPGACRPAGLGQHERRNASAAPVSVEEGAKITSTPARTSSAASCGICSWLSAQRNSRLRFQVAEVAQAGAQREVARIGYLGLTPVGARKRSVGRTDMEAPWPNQLLTSSGSAIGGLMGALPRTEGVIE